MLSRRVVTHLQVYKDSLHVLWTQDLPQWDHVILEERKTKKKKIGDFMVFLLLFLNSHRFPFYKQTV